MTRKKFIAFPNRRLEILWYQKTKNPHPKVVICYSLLILRFAAGFRGDCPVIRSSPTQVGNCVNPINSGWQLCEHNTNIVRAARVLPARSQEFTGQYLRWDTFIVKFSLLL